MENPTYEMLIDNEMFDGVYAISFVDDPAIREEYVLLSKEQKMKIEIKLDKIVDEKKKIVSGPALIPDLLIPRKGYNIIFSKDTIRKISENFLMNGHKDNVTLQHTITVNKVFLVESWIVDDPENDKSKKLGFNVPAGTWMVSFKIKDDELWTEFIETGQLKGFSIEGNFSSKETIEANKQKLEIDLDEALTDVVLRLTYKKEDLESYYKWEMNAGEGQCPSCKEYNGQVHKLKDWLNIAIPSIKNGTEIAGVTCSFPHSPYGTYCEDNCRCKLVKVQSPDFIKKHIVKPF